MACCPLSTGWKWGWRVWAGGKGPQTYWSSAVPSEACSPSRGSRRRLWSDRWPQGTARWLLQMCFCWWAASAHVPRAGWRGSRPLGNRSPCSRGASTWWWSSRPSPPQTAGPWEGELYLTDKSQPVIFNSCWGLFLKSQFPGFLRYRAIHRASHSRAKFSLLIREYAFLGYIFVVQSYCLHVTFKAFM